MSATIEDYFKNYRVSYGFIKCNIFRPRSWIKYAMQYRYNKKYYKADLTKDYYTYKEIVDFFGNGYDIKDFHTLDWLIKNGIITEIVRGTARDIRYISGKDIRDEFLRRECTCWKDFALFTKERCRSKKYRNVRKAGQKRKIVTYITIRERKYCIGKFHSSISEKVKKIVKEIYKHTDMFEEGHEYYVDPIYLYKLCIKIKNKAFDETCVYDQLKKLHNWLVKYNKIKIPK